MGIKNAVLRVANKAGNAVAKVSSLSSAQLDEIERKRESYLSENPTRPTRRQLSSRTAYWRPPGLKSMERICPSSGMFTAQWTQRLSIPTDSTKRTTSDS